MADAERVNGAVLLATMPLEKARDAVNFLDTSNKRIVLKPIHSSLIVLIPSSTSCLALGDNSNNNNHKGRRIEAM